VVAHRADDISPSLLTSVLYSFAAVFTRGKAIGAPNG
jgi:hypothetical protein